MAAEVGRGRRGRKQSIFQYDDDTLCCVECATSKELRAAIIPADLDVGHVQMVCGDDCEADLISSLEYIKSLGVLHPEPRARQQPLSPVIYDESASRPPGAPGPEPLSPGIIYDTAAGMLVPALQERSSSVIYDTADPHSSRLQYTVPRRDTGVLDIYALSAKGGGGPLHPSPANLSEALRNLGIGDPTDAADASTAASAVSEYDDCFPTPEPNANATGDYDNMDGVGGVSMSSSVSSPASEYSDCFPAAVVPPPVDHAPPGPGLESEGLPSTPRPRRLSVDAGLPQGSSNRFNKSGWIKKQGAGRRKFIGRKTWKTRWFVLEGTELRYYAGDSREKELGCAGLSSATRVHQHPRNKAAFNLYASGRCYRLVCPSKFSADQWISVIELACAADGGTRTSSPKSIKLAKAPEHHNRDAIWSDDEADADDPSYISIST